jgi:hypothetical protein
MGKIADDTFLDASLDDIATNGTTMHVNTAEPANRAAAISDSLATVALTGGDYVKAAGDTSGRKTTVQQQATLSITSTGTATHVSIIDSGSRLIYVTTCTSQALTSGGTVTVPAWDIEIRDPA